MTMPFSEKNVWKDIYYRLLKNIQMQGVRSPEEGGVHQSTLD